MEKRELIRKEILYYIEKNSRANLGELAVLLGTDEVTVANEIAEMEKDKVICGYHTLIDWDKAGVELVTALIEVRMTPQRSQGFDKIAERICNYPEVHAVYLISGGYDLHGFSGRKDFKRSVAVCFRKTCYSGFSDQYSDSFYFEEI